MNEKIHFNKLLDKIDEITLRLNQYRDDPNAVVGMMGVALKPLEKPNIPITAYNTLINSIEIVYRNSKNPANSN